MLNFLCDTVCGLKRILRDVSADLPNIGPAETTARMLTETNARYQSGAYIPGYQFVGGSGARSDVEGVEA